MCNTNAVATYFHIASKLKMLVFFKYLKTHQKRNNTSWQVKICEIQICITGTQPSLLTFISSLAAFSLPWHSWVAVTETTWPARLKTFTPWPFTEVCWPTVQKELHYYIKCTTYSIPVVTSISNTLSLLIHQPHYLPKWSIQTHI